MVVTPGETMMELPEPTDDPPQEPVYDVNATAFRTFFELPDDEWKWHFDVPGFDVRFIALDLNHTSDMGTTWQACGPETGSSSTSTAF